MTVCAQRENPISYGFNTVIAEIKHRVSSCNLVKYMQIELQAWQGVYFYLFILKFIFNLGKIVL